VYGMQQHWADTRSTERIYFLFLTENFCPVAGDRSFLPLAIVEGTGPQVGVMLVAYDWAR